VESTVAIDRRTQQIAAVRDALQWPHNLDPRLEGELASFAGRLVDAVEAVPRIPADQVGAYPDPAEPLVAALADALERIEANYQHEGSGPNSRFAGERLAVVQARFAVHQITEHLYERSLIRRDREQLDQAEARGWAAAVEALRDDDRYLAWQAHQPFEARQTRSWLEHTARYLDAVAPKATGGDVTNTPTLAGETGAEDGPPDHVELHRDGQWVDVTSYVDGDLSAVLRDRIGGT
jgi:hypothetical protein